MVSFAIVLFFAVTGLTLNHQDWFDGPQRANRFHGSVDMKWVTGTGKNVAKLEIVEYLRRTHGIKAVLSDFRTDSSQCEVAFKGPGYQAAAFIDRETGQYDLTENRLGLVAIVNDLHKGRDTGAKWSWVIDISAVLMTFISLTGIILILFLPKRRMSGLIALGGGALVCYLAYAIWVR